MLMELEESKRKRAAEDKRFLTEMSRYHLPDSTDSDEGPEKKDLRKKIKRQLAIHYKIKMPESDSDKEEIAEKKHELEKILMALNGEVSEYLRLKPQLERQRQQKDLDALRDHQRAEMKQIEAEIHEEIERERKAEEEYKLEKQKKKRRERSKQLKEKQVKKVKKSELKVGKKMVKK